MTLNAGHEPQALARPVLRAVRDARRPSVSSVEAANRFGKSRGWVTEQIQNGGIDGYGIKGPHRTRWYVYVDALPAGVPATADWPSSLQSASLPTHLLDRLVALLHEERRLRIESFAAVQGALDDMAEAAEAAAVGDTETYQERAAGAAEIAAKARRDDSAASLRANDLDRTLYALTRRLPADVRVSADEQ
jgi:hypothetical protein